jgi:PAS domain S-box-containing protein
MVNPLSNPFYLVTPLVGAAISFALAILVLRKDFKSRANRLFSLVLISLCSWSIFTFFMRASPDVERALYWDRLVFPAAIAMSVFYYHFTSTYTHKSRRKLLWGGYSLLVTACILSLAGLLISHMTLGPYGYAPHFHPTMYVIALCGIFFLVGGLLNLVRARGSATRHEDRTRLNYMIIAIIFPLIGGLADLIPNHPGLGIISNILFGVITAVAITRYHLLDIRIAMRKGLAYLLVSATVASIYIGLITLLNHILGATNVPIWTHVVLLFLLALVFLPLWQRMQRLVDRWFYRQRYDFLKQLERFSQEAHDISDINQLGSSLVHLLNQALQTSGIHLLLLSESGDFTVVASAGKDTARLTLRKRHPILRWLQSNRSLVYYQDLDIIPQLQSLTAKQRKELEAVRVNMFVPLKTKKNELVGLLLLGQKLSQQPYSPEDERLVLTVASRITVEVENARLYRDALRARETLEAWLNTMSDCVIIIGTDYTIQFMNRAAARRFGSTAGSKCWNILGKEAQCSNCPARQRPFKSENVSRYTINSGDRDYEVVAAPLLNADGSLSIIEVLRDVTERGKMEAVLRESEEKLRLTFESMTEGITVFDLNANIVEVNEAVLRMHGYDRKDELIGRSFLDLTAEKDRARAVEDLKKVLSEGCIESTEYVLLKKDGSEFDSELSVAVMRDASDKATGFVTITEDITERKQAEEREKKLRDELYLSSRLAAIGELASGVAHEINNPLTVILGFSQRVLRQTTDDKLRQALEIICNQALRTAQVVENLLTFARRREPKAQLANINDILQQALELRAYELKTSNIEVTLDLMPDLPNTMVDFGQIQQVFLNLIINAEHAMTEANGGGKLCIKTQKGKGCIEISFIDTGLGIPAEYLDRVFDPFFTTKEKTGGTGLGLSLCHSIVTEHGGKIYVKSKPRRGATFTIELPLPAERPVKRKV